MSTLLLRLAAPMQSWGMASKFETRGTERAPTKSGVIGMVASALGRRRDESVDDLNGLRFGIRADRPGTVIMDYHTAKSSKSSYVTYRYYLSDAVFLAGLEGEEKLLLEIEAALKQPMFPLYLGRRSCPPTQPLCLGIRPGVSLDDALLEEPSLVSAKDMADMVRIATDSKAADANGYFVRDVAKSFSQKRRQYGFRKVSDIMVKNNATALAEKTAAQHDPMAELEE